MLAPQLVKARSAFGVLCACVCVGWGGGRGTGESGTTGLWIWTPVLGLILYPVPNYDLKNEKHKSRSKHAKTLEIRIFSPSR